MTEETLTHRQLAIDLFNQTWSLLDKPQRTQDEDDLMIHSAHASRYHWGQVGSALEFTRGEWQISRVYSVLGRSEPALVHARRALELCQEHGIGDFDLAFAYEALARASHVAGHRAERELYRGLALEASGKIADQEDHNILMNDMATIPID